MARKAHKCLYGSYYNSATDTCVNTDNNCKIYDVFSGKCYRCNNPNWKIINNVCTDPNSPAALVCPAGTYKKVDKCVPDGCSDTDAAGKCTGCLTAYVISGDVCVLKTCPSGQVLEMATGNCLVVCPAGNQNIDNVCYVIPPNCEKLSPHKSCQNCVTGYEFVAGGACEKVARFLQIEQ